MNIRPFFHAVMVLFDAGMAAALLLAVTSRVPLKYNVRNVFVRWRATLATVLGVALVVAVFVLVQSLARYGARGARRSLPAIRPRP